RHTRSKRDWSSDVCSSDLNAYAFVGRVSQYYVTGDFYPRPTLIYVEHCNHISFTGVTMRNAPFWTLHPAGCDDVLISQIRILNRSEERRVGDGCMPKAAEQ